MTITSIHKKRLRQLTICLHVFVFTFSYLIALVVPSFDSSANLILKKTWLTSLLRWDAFHFVHVARDGYVFEHEYAFFPGTPFVGYLASRTIGSIGNVFGLATEEKENVFTLALLGGLLASMTASVAAVSILYDLTLKHFKSPNFALLTGLLSLVSSSPATLRLALYSEPFFAYFSYSGMLLCSEHKWAFASAAFAGASLFRSNGVLLSGFLIWGMIIEPLLTQKPIPKHKRSHLPLGVFDIVYSALLSSVVVSPFALHQYRAYQNFCSSSSLTGTPQTKLPEWCFITAPLVYNYVQSKYWNVGPFRYWTPAQIPNFLLAAPVLALLLYGSSRYFSYTLLPELRRFFTQLLGWRELEKSPESFPGGSDVLNSLSIAPHVIYVFILTMSVLIFAHVQIILRFASASPFTYWVAASLWTGQPVFKNHQSNKGDIRQRIASPLSRWWVGWSLLWSASSIVLWSVFLPPA